MKRRVNLQGLCYTHRTVFRQVRIMEHNNMVFFASISSVSYEPNQLTALKYLYYGKSGDRIMFLLSVLTVIISSSLLLAPVLYRELLDRVIYSKDIQAAIFFALSLVVINLISSVLRYLKSVLSEKEALNRAKRRLVDYLSRFYSLSVRDALRGEHYLNVLYDRNLELSREEIGLILKGVGVVSGGIFAFAGGLYIAPPLFLTSAGLWILMAILTSRLSSILQKISAAELEEESRLKGNLMDFFRAFKLWRNIPAKMEYLVGSFREYGKRFIRLELFRSFLFNSTWFFNQFVFVFAIVFGGYLTFIHVISLSDFLATIYLLGNTWGVMAEFMELLPMYKEIKGKREAMEGSFHPLEEYRERCRGVRCDRVVVSYEGKAVLNGLNLRMNPGDRILLYGPNGSGKTTLGHLISGNLKPDSGRVCVPARVSSVLLPLKLPPVKVGELLSENNVREFSLSDLKEKVCTELSAGQKKKVAIALALSRDADLYVLDEPLANLDAGAKEYFLNKILERTEGKSLILISHEKVEGLKEVGMDVLQSQV